MVLANQPPDESRCTLHIQYQFLCNRIYPATLYIRIYLPQYYVVSSTSGVEVEGYEQEKYTSRTFKAAIIIDHAGRCSLRARKL